jgi:GT2 family glycosyltransferase
MVSGQEAIHVVVPSWRGRAHVELLLESLAAQSVQPASVLIVDGGSNDGTVETARNAGADVLDLNENKGFAHAVNRGIAESSAHRIAVLNNDLRLAPDWIEQISRTNAPFVAGKVLAWDTTDQIDATWDLLSQSGVPMRAGHGKTDGAFWNQPREIALAPWTAVLIRRDYWQATGGLDESFESYLEDVDIGMRGLKLGFRGRYQPSAVAWHRGSSTLGAWHPRQVRLSSRNQLRLVARHGEPDWWKILIGQSLWGFAAARHGCFKPWLDGKREALQEFRKPRQDNQEALSQLEREIFDVNAVTGFDRFWRWYWALNS